MSKSISIFIIGLLVGVIGCAVFFFGYAMPNLGKSIIMIQEAEILKQGESAYHAYLNEKPSIAVWAYENYINTLKRIKEERRNIKKEDPYFLITLDRDLIISYGRLGVLYKITGDNDKAILHFNEALSINKLLSLYEKIQTESDLISFLSDWDSMQKNKKTRKSSEQQ